MPSVFFMLNISFAPKYFCFILIITLNINIFPFANYTVENACFHGVLYIWIKSKMPVAFGTQFKKRKTDFRFHFVHARKCLCVFQQFKIYNIFISNYTHHIYKRKSVLLCSIFGREYLSLRCPNQIWRRMQINLLKINTTRERNKVVIN